VGDFIFDYGMRHGAYPATLNYRGYRKSSCTSVNHVVRHGIPNEKPLREGDIVSIDVTYVLDGWHGDSSRMYGAGQMKRAAERLIEVRPLLAALEGRLNRAIGLSWSFGRSSNGNLTSHHMMGE
jgi:methionine aminopeptidase